MRTARSMVLALGSVVIGCGGGGGDGVRVRAAPAADPVRVAAPVDRGRRAEVAAAIARVRAGSGAKVLTREQVRAATRGMVPALRGCYQAAIEREPGLDGVVNPMLTLDSDGVLGTIVTVRGLETGGALGQAAGFGDCVRATLEGLVLPPIAGGGTLAFTYPITFAPAPPDNHDTALFERASQAATAGQWGPALVAAEAGLALTSLDGPHRRKLIEVAGLAACHTRDEAKARRYGALASPAVAPVLRATCARAAGIALAP